MMKKLNLLFSIVIVLIFRNVYAQQSATKIDSFLIEKESLQEVNGSIFVSEQNKVVLSRNAGFEDFEAKIKISDTTLFQYASISKTITAVAILQLMEKSRLKLDDKFVLFFPDFPFPDITIRQMLSHTSGLPDLNVFQNLVTGNPDRIITNSDIIPELIRNKRNLLFKPGEKWSYCNANFNLLGLLIEKVSGLSYQDYLEKYIFKPAKMHYAYIKTSLINSVHLPGEAYYYDYQYIYSANKVRISESFFIPRFKIQYYNSFGFNGAGSIYGRISDLINFDKALYDGVLLKQATLELAFTPTKLNDGSTAKASIGLGKAGYGLGWFVFDDQSSGKTVWHSGGRYGCQTMLLRNVTKKQTVIILDNNENPGVYETSISAMAMLNGLPQHKYKKSLAKIYAQSLIKNGADFAVSKVLSLRPDTINYILREEEMNNVGYEFLANNFTSQALESFRINVLFFPKSDNVYDSYGEVLLGQGKVTEAELMYQRAVEINQNNKSSSAALVKIRKNKIK